MMSCEIGEYSFNNTQYPDEWHRFKNKIDKEIKKRSKE